MKRSPIKLALMLLLLAGCEDKQVSYADGIIASFESSAEIQPDEGTAAIRASTEHATNGKYSLEATLEGSESGFGFHAIGKPFDFSSASKLYFDVYRDGPPISLIVRTFDESGKPYVVWYYHLDRGPNLVEIDVNGMKESGLDISKINRLYMYVEEGSGKVFVDNVRLAKEPIDLGTLITKPTEHPKRVPPGNGLLNGDFEAGLSGWSSWGEWDDGLYFFGSGFNDDACSGSASLKITCEKPGRGGVFTEPMFMPAGVYDLRFWAKGDPSGSVMRWTFEGDAEARAAVTSNFESQPFALTDQWREFHYTVPIRQNAALRLYFFSLGKGTVYIDAASLVLQGKEDLPPYRAPANKPPRVVSIKDGRFQLDGKSFFPIGAYLGKPSMLAGTGFNCLMPSMMTPDVVQESDQSGILLTPELTGVLRGHLPWQVGIAVEPFKGHPNLFGWYMCDEPDHAKMTVPPAELRLATKQVHAIDPNRLTWAVVMSWADSNMYQYADTVDVLATDIYPIDDANSKRPLVEVGEKTDILKKATGPDKPGIAVLQSTGKATPAEEVAMTYLALTHGANGVFYWQLFEAQENPQVWQTIVNLTREMNALTPVLNAPDFDRPVRVSDPNIHTLTRRLGNRVYVLAVNASPNPVNGVRFEHSDSDGSPVKVLFEHRDSAVSGKNWADNFDGYARHVYSIPAH